MVPHLLHVSSRMRLVQLQAVPLVSIVLSEGLLQKMYQLFTVSVGNMGSRSMEQGAGSTQPIPNSEPMPTPGPEVSVVCEVEQERQPPGADGSEAFLHSALVSSGPTPKGGKKRKT